MMKAIEEGRDYAGPPAVVELLRARQEVELHKIPTIAEFLQNLLDEGCSVFICGRIGKRSVLGWRMSRNGIRSLVILLLVMSVVWIAVTIKILHVAGVFNG